MNGSQDTRRLSVGIDSMVGPTSDTRLYLRTIKLAYMSTHRSRQGDRNVSIANDCKVARFPEAKNLLCSQLATAHQNELAGVRCNCEI